MGKSVVSSANWLAKRSCRTQKENFLQITANFTNYTSSNCYLRYSNVLTTGNVAKWRSLFNEYCQLLGGEVQFKRRKTPPGKPLNRRRFRLHSDWLETFKRKIFCDLLILASASIGWTLFLLFNNANIPKNKNKWHRFTDQDCIILLWRECRTTTFSKFHGTILYKDK